MKIILLSGINSKGMSTMVDDENYDYLNQWKWKLDRGYAVRTKLVNGKYCNIRMHRIVIDAPDNMFVDHINMNKLDNRLENLRLATKAQNMANTPLRKDNTSGYKGISWRKDRNKWAVNIGNKKYGQYSTIKEANEVYNRMAKNIYGEFARLNI